MCTNRTCPKNISLKIHCHKFLYTGWEFREKHHCSLIVGFGNIFQVWKELPTIFIHFGGLHSHRLPGDEIGEILPIFGRLLQGFQASPTEMTAGGAGVLVVAWKSPTARARTVPQFHGPQKNLGIQYSSISQLTELRDPLVRFGPIQSFDEIAALFEMLVIYYICVYLNIYIYNIYI